MAAPARTVSPGIRWARIVPVPMRAAEEKKLGDCKHNLRVFCFIYPYAGFDAISMAEISAGVDIDDCCRISAADFMQIPQGAANREGRAAGRPPKAGQRAKPAETVRRTVWPAARPTPAGLRPAQTAPKISSHPPNLPPNKNKSSCKTQKTAKIPAGRQGFRFYFAYLIYGGVTAALPGVHWGTAPVRALPEARW